jgi:hypothetical protein
MVVTRQSPAAFPAGDTGLPGPDGHESPTAAAELSITLVAIDPPDAAPVGQAPKVRRRTTDVRPLLAKGRTRLAMTIRRATERPCRAAAVGPSRRCVIPCLPCSGSLRATAALRVVPGENIGQGHSNLMT